MRLSLSRVGILILAVTAGALFCFAGNDADLSLAGRSNMELLQIIRGGRSESSMRRQEPVIETHLPKDFWTLPARDAALALVLTNCSEETRKRLSFSIPDSAEKKAPTAGEVGIRWEGTGSGPMAGGLIILRAAGEKSHLAYSAVELEGEATRKQIAAAVNRTRTVALPDSVARHAFEVIWWLGRLRTTGKSPDSFTVVTHESEATFWITPGMAQRKHVTLRGAPGDRIDDEFDADTHASFADFVIREAARQQPEKLETVTASLGAGVYPDAGLKFLRTHEQPQNGEDIPTWIGQTLKILRAPEYRSWGSFAIGNLVAWQEPMRYADPRIDEALLQIVRENLPRNHENPTVKEGSGFKTLYAVRALAWRDRVEIFPPLLTALRVMRGWSELDKDDVLAAAALLGSRHAELRSEIIAYLRAQLSDIAGSDHAAGALFDTVWRFEFRELKPLLQEVATASEEELEDRRGEWRIDPPRPVTRRFHAARKILLTWNEPDAVTKLKLDSLLQASSTDFGPPPELLRRQFEDRSTREQEAFHEFIAWMKGQELPYNWQPERVEWAVSPEALAAAR